MARERKKSKTDLDVVGFLSVMSIVTGLICLILFVIALRIAMNPELVKIVSFELFTSKRAVRTGPPKVPTYIDCGSSHIVIYPGETRLTWEDLKRPDNELEKTLDKILRNRAREYVIVMVRPKSVDLYRQVRTAIGKKDIDVGYDAVDADFKVNWNEAVKRLGVTQ